MQSGNSFFPVIVNQVVRKGGSMFLVLLLSVTLPAQELKHLTLQQAYDLSRANYPVIRQKDLVEKTKSLTIDNLRKALLPQLSLGGQASYQSDVTSIPVPLPGVEAISKDQYKVFAELNQLLYDGGVTREQERFQEYNAAVEDQKLEVELYRIRERVNQLYLGILFLSEQEKLVDLVKSDIQTGIDRVAVQVENGVAFRSSLNMLKAELLKAGQRTIELRNARSGMTDALVLFLGKPLAADVQLEKPAPVLILSADPVGRPEIKLFNDQQKLTLQQEKLITARSRPKASLFVQGGYGRPALNQLKNEFDLYYIGGLKLNWSLGSLYTRKKEKELLSVNRNILDIQREAFILNTHAQLRQQEAEIRKWSELVASDQDIISLRSSVTEAAKALLENGVITPADYLRELNAEDQARQSLITHELQMIQAQINYQTIAGKQ